MKKLLVTLMGLGTMIVMVGCTGGTSALSGLGGQLATGLAGLLLSSLISGAVTGQ